MGRWSRRRSRDLLLYRAPGGSREAAVPVGDPYKQIGERVEAVNARNRLYLHM